MALPGTWVALDSQGCLIDILAASSTACIKAAPVIPAMLAYM